MKYETRLVYSTEIGRIKEEKQSDTTLTGDGRARVQKETKGRGGKVVTCIYDLHLNKSELSQLTKTLKKRCGTGGACKNGVIEIQGDWMETIKNELVKLGHKVRGK